MENRQGSANPPLVNRPPSVPLLEAHPQILRPLGSDNPPSVDLPDHSVNLYPQQSWAHHLIIKLLQVEEAALRLLQLHQILQ